MSEPAAAPRNPPGRPNRISRAGIVAASLGILEAEGLAAFSMARLARELNSSPMAFYTYFRGRDDILDAVADHIFGHFEPPPADAPWREGVAAWLEGLRRLFERWPVALRLVKWDAHIAPAWLRAWLPMVRLLQNAGLEGDRLAFAAAFLGRAGMGLIVGHLQAPTESGVGAWLSAADLSAGDRALAETMFVPERGVSDAELYAFGVEGILAALARLLEPGAGSPG